MPEIAIRLDPKSLAHPDLDLRYELPSKLEAISGGRVRDDAYDYDSAGRMIVFLVTSDLVEGLALVLSALATIEVLGNRFHDAVVAVADTDHCSVPSQFRIVHPPALEGSTLAST